MYGPKVASKSFCSKLLLGRTDITAFILGNSGSFFFLFINAFLKMFSLGAKVVYYSLHPLKLANLDGRYNQSVIVWNKTVVFQYIWFP
jgi:hypothetical protein